MEDLHLICVLVTATVGVLCILDGIKSKYFNR